MADGTFILQDDQAQAYSELWSYAPAGVGNKGDLVIRQDCAAFLLNDSLSSLNSLVLSEVALIYYAQQVRANKEVGTGYDFVTGLGSPLTQKF